MLSKIKELKEIRTKLEELEMKILGKMYRNERNVANETRNRIESKKKTKKSEYIIREHRIGIDTVISDAKDLRITAINKLNEMERIETKIDELEKEKALGCVEYE